MANFDMHKRTPKSKPKKQQDREHRDFAETAFAVFQQATSGKRLTRRQEAATGAQSKIAASFSFKSRQVINLAPPNLSDYRTDRDVQDKHKDKGQSRQIFAR